MKNHLYKAALAVVLGLAGATAAQAQVNPNDLVLGFTSQASGANVDDYIIDLGQLPFGGNNIANYNTALNVSGFNYSAFTGSGVAGAASLGSLSVGIVGGNNGTGTHDIFLSELDNGTGSPIGAGSSTPTEPISGTDFNLAAGKPSGLSLGAVPVGGANGVNESWTYNIAENPTTGGTDTGFSYTDYLGNNPMTTLDSESVVLDLWNETGSTHSLGAWTFDGTVTLSLNNQSDSLSAVYDYVAPEPSTYSIFGGFGLLLFGLRRKLTGKLA